MTTLTDIIKKAIEEFREKFSVKFRPEWVASNIPTSMLESLLSSTIREAVAQAFAETAVDDWKEEKGWTSYENRGRRAALAEKQRKEEVFMDNTIIPREIPAEGFSGIVGNKG